MPTHRLPKILLATAITCAIHSTLHAATDIESGTNGTGQGASASVTSSDSSNTITATAASGAPNSNGGNATASATLTPTADSNSTLTATGGMSGLNNNRSLLPTIGGSANTSATVNAAGNVTLTLTATAGTGDTALDSSYLNGTGGSATASASVIASGNISINVTAQGGAGGGYNIAPSIEGTGGAASITSVSAVSTSGDITLVANELGGNGNNSTFFNSPYGMGGDASATNILSASTSGNITLTQNAEGGYGRIVGNAYSSLTFTSLTAASITANVMAIPNLFHTFNGGSPASGGSSYAYVDITGNANVVATAEADGDGTATAIAHGGYVSGFVAGANYAKATAIGLPTAGPLSAAAYASDRYFSNAEIFATSSESEPESVSPVPQFGICAGFFNVAPMPNLYAIQGTFSLTGPVSSTNDPNRIALVALSTTRLSTPTLAQTGIFSIGFEGMLDTSLLPDQDLIIALVPGLYDFHQLQFTVSINNNTEFSNSYTNLTFAPAAKITYFDLGPLKNFGDDPLDLKIEMDATFSNLNESFQISSLEIYDMNPALLTPEPASLSLLAAATLPLLLKRRRNI